MNENLGSLLRSLLNDLKRRPQDAAKELGISREEMQSYLDDELSFPSELITKACQVWPVSPREFARVFDDTPHGIKIMRASVSKDSARVMDRKGKPYYEYRDTAASSLSSFRPEWIKELLEVESNAPDNPEAQWNNGHFMHQFTYFVGPVNFYYIGDDGKKQVAIMNTGDSMYIRPFVPHTFSTRKNEGGGGLILALTYGGSLLGDTQQELGAVSTALAEQYSLDYSSVETAVGSMVQYYMDCLTLTKAELERRSGVSLDRITKVIGGTDGFDHSDLQKIAFALGVNLRDLLAYDAKTASVVVEYEAETTPWDYATSNGNYVVRELASTPNMPMAKSLKFEFSQSDCSDYQLKIGLHQYIYNVGQKNIEVRWRVLGEQYSETLEPNDSAFIKPFVEHCYNSDAGELISLRIPSKVSGDSLRELSLIGKDNIHRVANEQMPWFDKNGKN